MVLLEYKRCARCGRLLHVSKFHKNASQPDGLQMHCKECERIATREWQAKVKNRKAIKHMAQKMFDGEIPLNYTTAMELIRKVKDM
jgi:nicotinamide mononucleotide adenylyltransferase